MLDKLCPKCLSVCPLHGTCASRGEIYECASCKMPPNSDEALLWFYDSDRLWEDLNKPEPMSKPTLVKVILVVPFSRIQFISGKTED